MGILYLVATPIGNLEDISPRALRILRESILVAAEDTRHTGSLLAHFGIKSQLTSYFEHNKLNKLDLILAKLTEGDVALVSDAGTPAINDPGYELVREALASGFDVRPVPGPSSPIAALSVSGLPTDSFLYLGYFPHKASERRAKLESVSQQPHTLIFLESPHRVVDALADILSALGDRRICVAREMTKLYEEFWRGQVSGALEYFTAKEPRGEFTLVVEGRLKEEQVIWSEDQLRQAVGSGLENGRTAKELSSELAVQSGWSKKDVYAFINQIK